MDVCEELRSQRNKINHQIGQVRRRGNEDIIPELIAVHNESLEAVKKKFPGYEIPLTAQLGVDRTTQKRFHENISSTLRRKFETGNIWKNPKWKVKNPMTTEEKNYEFTKTIRRLLARKRVLRVYVLCTTCVLWHEFG